MAELAVSDPVEIKKAVSLDWLYNQNRIAFELFSSTYTLLDSTEAVTGVTTVAGDDSIDIDDTSALEVGHEYIVFDGTDTISVVVVEILTGTRFTAAANATISMTDASLVSTSFSLAGGAASADPDSVYLAHGINIDNQTDAAVIIRHSGDPGDLRLYYQDGDHAGWTEAYWKWQRAIDTGVVDVEYALPSRGWFNLKLVHEGSAQIDIYHLVCVGSDTGLLGDHHPPETPVNAEPADAATDIQEAPTLMGSSYVSLAGAVQYAMQAQVADAVDGFDAPVLDSGDRPAGSGYSISKDILAVGTQYFWRIRYQDEHGFWSDWSAPTSFTTASSFEYVAAPSNVAPENGAICLQL